MAALEELLRQRREREEATAKVYEDYGKQKFEFKHGGPQRKRRAFDIPAMTIFQAAELPTEAYVEASEPIDNDMEKPLHRFVWKMQKVRFHISEQTPEVQKGAIVFQKTYDVPKDVAIRLALLQEIGAEKHIINTYLASLELFAKGIETRKLCLGSSKIRKRLLSFERGTLRISSTFSETTVEMGVICDAMPGAYWSPEFREKNKKLKQEGQMLQDGNCCVISTFQRTYSFIMFEKIHVDLLCALVDLYKGQNGPRVWTTGKTETPNVFQHD